MPIVALKDCESKLDRLGRTYDGPDGEIFMDWTCSGLRFGFTGKYLIAQLSAVPGEETDINPLDGTVSKRKTWSYLAVFIDDNENPARYFEVNNSSENYLLYSSENNESHIITIRKITENPKGKLSISKFLTDGEIEKAIATSCKLNIEFIGDSITCGFGNLSNEKDGYFSHDENGWLSHAVIAAQKLNAQFSIISYSGIAITKGLGNYEWQLPSMVDIYPYTDRLIEEKSGVKSNFKKWDFMRNRPDVIVINLGTNDATVIEYNKDIKKGIEKFENDYYNFLKMIRENNGMDQWIICTLGSMDYFLFDNIQKVVKRYSTENNDNKIKCFKYGRMRITEGSGACGHPNVITQKRMGNEIADYITELLDL